MGHTLTEKFELKAFHRIATELVKADLIKNEEWVVKHCDIAMNLVPNEMETIACLLAATHRNAIEYLTQAPILMVMAAGGHPLTRKGDRLYTFRKFRRAVEGRPKLRKLMRAYCAPFHLRRLPGRCLKYDDHSVFNALCAMPDKVLASCIPKDEHAMIVWWQNLCNYSDQSIRRGQREIVFAEWAAKHMPSDCFFSAAADLADFTLSTEETFNERWTLWRAYNEMQEWHKAVREGNRQAVFEAEFGRPFDFPVLYHPLPDKFDCGKGHRLVALRSGRDLYMNGVVMHHCVGTYFDDIRKGRSRIYCLESDMPNGSVKHWATLELNPSEKCLEILEEKNPLMPKEIVGKSQFQGWKIGQLKGPCNESVQDWVRTVCEIFVEQVNNKIATYEERKIRAKGRQNKERMHRLEMRLMR